MNQVQIHGSEHFLKPKNEHLMWKREFDELGPEKVRTALIHAEWEPRKRAAARQWLDRADSLNWKNARPERGSMMFRLHSAKWWGLAVGVMVAGMAIGRLLRKW